MPDDRSLTVVIDSSGSMREVGKIMIARNLVNYVRECLRFGSGCGSVRSIRLFSWGSETSVINLQDDLDVQSIQAAGEANGTKLLQAFNGLFDASSKSRVLLLSDGYFVKAELNFLLEWIQKTSSVSLRAIAIGADAKVESLAKIAEDDGVFIPEDISFALHPWPLRDSPTLPNSLDDFPFPEDKENGE